MGILGRFRRLFDASSGEARAGLYYFEEILPFEFAAINARRAAKGTRPSPISRRRPEKPSERPAESGAGSRRARSPDPDRLFAEVELASQGRLAAAEPVAEAEVRARRPDRDRMRPRPVPCDANGLAFSGGGVRSAAVCLGALQALHSKGRLASIDYLSTVSGGGYIGSCLSAAMTPRGGGAFPFGEDVSDSPAIAHLRNYSNYLMPRGRSGIRNLAEAAAIILRGMLANLIVVTSVLLLAVLATVWIFAEGGLGQGSLLLRLADAAVAPTRLEPRALLGPGPFGLSLTLFGLFAAVLILWACLRSFRGTDRVAGDTTGPLVVLARWLLIAAVLVVFLDLQPVLISGMIDLRTGPEGLGTGLGDWLGWIWGGLLAFAGIVAAFASGIGNFLAKSERADRIRTLLLRAVAKLALVAAALVLPATIWLAYLWLTARGLDGSGTNALETWLASTWAAQVLPLGGNPIVTAYQLAFLATTFVGLLLTANAYSLHRFYRDRLSKAFLFSMAEAHPWSNAADRPAPDPPTLDDLKLSDLQAGEGPYHLINAAMNVQGSKEANRRGRDADFFMFSSQFVGSDLTLYAGTGGAVGSADAVGMEQADPRLDLASAMAVSGAAVSANMGSNTVRLLSPTLALLNVRLGYWLRSPRAIAVHPRLSPFVWLKRKVERAQYLLTEMLNQHDERAEDVYLTDGGHIENLGLYELLKRGCQLIIVVDSEADPAMSFSSLLKVERYARIDLGVRITLPWEEIARSCRKVSEDLRPGDRPGGRGPHCAVGRIVYEDGVEGVLLYFKSSVSGDEKDYILDYKVRHPDFPHETTGDQFFSEEQFEMYRALGFHMVAGFFGTDHFPFELDPNLGLENEIAVRAYVDTLLPPA